MGEIAHGAISAQPAQGQVAASRTIGMPIDCLMGDVQAFAIWQAVELSAYGIP